MSLAESLADLGVAQISLHPFDSLPPTLQQRPALPRQYEATKTAVLGRIPKCRMLGDTLEGSFHHILAKPTGRSGDKG